MLKQILWITKKISTQMGYGKNYTELEISLQKLHSFLWGNLLAIYTFMSEFFK